MITWPWLSSDDLGFESWHSLTWRTNFCLVQNSSFFMPKLETKVTGHRQTNRLCNSAVYP